MVSGNDFFTLGNTPLTADRDPLMKGKGGVCLKGDVPD